MIDSDTNEHIHSLAGLLQQEGFSVAVVSPDVTYEELEAMFPSKKEVGQDRQNK